MSINKLVENLLKIAQDTFKMGPRLTQKTGLVNAKGDQTIAMDARLEDLFINYIKAEKIPAHIFSEEVGLIPYDREVKYVIAFDPLDGSTNYTVGGGLLPFGSLIAVYQGSAPTLGKVIAAGAY